MWGNFSNLQHNFDILCSHGEKPITAKCLFPTLQKQNIPVTISQKNIVKVNLIKKKTKQNTI